MPPTRTHHAADDAVARSFARRGESSLLRVLVVSGTLALVALGFAFESLRRAADRHECLTHDLADLQVETHRLDALEWRITASGVTDELQRELTESRRRLAITLDDLREHAPGSAAIAEAAARSHAYTQAVDQQVLLRREGRRAEAETLDEERVDPAFDALEVAVRNAAEFHEKAARDDHAAAARVSFLMVAATLAALWTMAWRFHLTRARAAREEAASLERERVALHTRALEERYHALFDAHPRPMWVYDRETLGFLAVNDAAVAAYGWPREAWAGMTLCDLRPPEDVPVLLAHLRDSRQDGTPTHWRHRRRDGSEFPVEVIARSLRFGDRDASLVVATDLTAERALELKLRRSQRMDAVGQLAGGVAHDFNNLLTAISGYTQLLGDRVRADTTERRYVDEIARASGRAANLTRQLLAFSRQQVLRPQVLDLNAAIRETQKMLERLIGEDIQLVFKPAPDLGRIEADPGQIEQVVVNLAVNARDAMPRGGRLEFATENVPAGAGEPARVRLRVSDDGFGMDDATQERIFEPFFTTKPAGHGTGLGLSTVHGIVHQSGGTIRVTSAPASGTTFEIDFPRHEGATPAERTAPAAAPARAHAECVLLVEDEEYVRDLVAELLGSLGYRVHVTRSGTEAIELARASDEVFDLVLTDVIMPGMGGRETAERLRELRPGQRVLFMSGYTDDAIVRHGVIEAKVPFLPKPFTLQQLAATVRQALEDPRAAA